MTSKMACRSTIDCNSIQYTAAENRFIARAMAPATLIWLFSDILIGEELIFVWNFITWSFFMQPRKEEGRSSYTCHLHQQTGTPLLCVTMPNPSINQQVYLCNGVVRCTSSLESFNPRNSNTHMRCLQYRCKCKSWSARYNYNIQSHRSNDQPTDGHTYLDIAEMSTVIKHYLV